MNPADIEINTQHQKLRFKRLLWGLITYGCVLIVVFGYLFSGFIQLHQAIYFLISVIIINLVFVLLIKTNLNLKFKDPSLTALQVFTAVLPSVYIMYHVSDAQARMAFLLMATIAMLLGCLALKLEQMLSLTFFVLMAYILLLAALFAWAPERLNLRVEPVIIISYGMVLILISYIGSFIYGLRSALREKNQSLKEAMNELEELVRKDPLTRLPNRLFIMEQLEREQARTERRVPEQSTLCLCMLDIDFFKKINDTYGHQVGDTVLRQVGDTLIQNMRQSDFVGRFGGEEFLCILPESTLESAKNSAERIRKSISEMKISDIPDHPPITISIGIAAHEKGQTISSTINKADEALYEAKNSGRNRVVVYQKS